jgi:hypothetical protein
MPELKQTEDLRHWNTNNTNPVRKKRKKFLKPKNKSSIQEITKLLKNKRGGKIMQGYKAGGKV